MEKQLITKQCENCCPGCGKKKKIEWQDYRVYDSAMEIPGYCENCGCEFIEFFEVNYKETKIDYLPSEKDKND